MDIANQHAFYRKSHCYNKDIKAIAIDSSGLKCFGHEEWHIHKYKIQPMDKNICHVTADGAYDNNPTYKKLTKQFPSVDIVIPPQKGATYNKENEFFRNRNILEIKYHGHMEWQKRREYSKRNHSELAIQRYKKILGNKLHARDFERQKQEAITGCSILNKMMCLTLGEFRSKF